MTLLDSVLEVAAVFIIPDWDLILSLIPVLLLLLFVAWSVMTARKWATVGPTRRAPARVEPLPPAHVHMPGGSAAPILVALGAGGLFLGLVAGGPLLLVGVAVLVVTLLVWFREAFREYTRLEPPRPVPAVIGPIHQGPPPGVHMPGPSIRPLLGAIGSAALLGGLVVGGWVLILAVIFFVWTLIGWLLDFTAEYRKVEEADRTGHLENIPDRRLPTRTLQVFAVLFAVVGLWQLGVFPPASPATAGPGASGPPPSGLVAPPGALEVVAKDLTFDKKALEVTAGQAFAIVLRNEDAPGTPHDIDIQSPAGALVKDQPRVDGGASAVYQYDALQAGDYVFICSVHPIPQMTGTLTVK